MNQNNSPAFRFLDDNAQFILLCEVMAEIKILTGAILYPEANGQLEVQVKVIQRFLNTSPDFRRLTKTEILHAFYLNNQGMFDKVYAHYNRELNAEFIGNVLLAYVRFRNRLYNRIGPDLQRLLGPEEPQKEIPVITDDAYMIMIQEDYEMFRNGNTEMIFGFREKYSLLRRIGLIKLSSRKQWFEFFQRSMSDRIHYAYNSSLTDARERRKLEDLRAIYDDCQQRRQMPWPGFHTGEFYAIVFNMKRLRYLSFLNRMQETGVNKIFDEVTWKLICPHTHSHTHTAEGSAKGKEEENRGER